MINNKKYIIRKNIFNKGNKNKLCYVDESRINIFVLFSSLYHICTMVQKRGKDKTELKQRSRPMTIHTQIHSYKI